MARRGNRNTLPDIEVGHQTPDEVGEDVRAEPGTEISEEPQVDEGEPPFEPGAITEAADAADAASELQTTPTPPATETPAPETPAAPAAERPTIPLAPEVAPSDPQTAAARVRLAEIEKKLAEMGDPAGEIRTAQERWREHDAEMRDTVRSMNKRCNDLKAQMLAVQAKKQKAAWDQGQLMQERERLLKQIG